MKRLILAALFALTAGTPARARAADDPREIIVDATARIKVLVLSAQTDEELREKAKEIMAEFVDFAAFGKLCLGKQWKALTPQQQEAYLAQFRVLLQRTYLRRFKRGADFTVEYKHKTRFSKAGDRAEVKTEITSVDVGADVDYRFRKTDKWMAYDIVVDEVSVMRNYRRAFVKLLKKEGFDALLEKMKKKDSEELDEVPEVETAK